MNAHQYVYQMQRLGKVFQSGRVVLKEISLSFCPVPRSVCWV